MKGLVALAVFMVLIIILGNCLKCQICHKKIGFDGTMQICGRCLPQYKVKEAELKKQMEYSQMKAEQALDRHLEKAGVSNGKE